MFIGHIPAGYLVSKALFRRFKTPDASSTALICASILGAIAPDADLLYFYLIDQRQHQHHSYFTHFPVVWLCLLLASIWWLRNGRARPQALLTVAFCMNGFGHMILDSVVGDIQWFAPFIDKPFSLFGVPALYRPWWLNYVLHWSFGLEIGLVCAAALVWRRDCRVHRAKI